jgi:hypothetical protein
MIDGTVMEFGRAEALEGHQRERGAGRDLRSLVRSPDHAWGSVAALVAAAAAVTGSPALP